MKRNLLVITALLTLGVTQAHAGYTYGAISISPSTGARGTSWNRWNLYDAQAGAQLNCGVADCFVAVNVSGACASVAVGYNAIYGYAIRGNAFLAAQAALANCAIRTGNCFTSATICTP